MKGQTWEAVTNVLQLMQKEAEQHEFVIPAMKVQKPIVSVTSL
jgi:hypothetical protein